MLWWCDDGIVGIQLLGIVRWTLLVAVGSVPGCRWVHVLVWLVHFPLAGTGVALAGLAIVLFAGWSWPGVVLHFGLSIH